MPPIAHDVYPWLNNILLNKVLKDSENSDKVEIIDYALQDAVGKGENYASHLVRVSVNFIDQNSNTHKCKSFVVKTALAPEINEKYDKMAIFPKEFTIYRNILPNFDKYLAAVDENFKFAARCFEASDHPYYFVFEDLNQNGYRNNDRRIGLNFKAASMVLEKLAKYHAMGALLCCERPELKEIFRTKVVNSEDTEMMDLFLCGVKDCQELSSKWPGYEHLSVKLEKLSKVIIGKVEASFKPDESEFNVITHGDLWTNNIMFKFDDEQNPIDVIMVDFQMGYFSSPAIDIAYLLLTSTSNDVKEVEWDRLVQIYHAQLVRSLKAINYPKRIPTLTDIQIQILKRSLYSVLISLLMISSRHLEKTDSADLFHFVFDDEKAKMIRHETYEKPEAKERVLYYLDYFERKGLLESD